MEMRVLSFLTALLLCTPAWASYTNIYGGGAPNSSKFDIVFVEYDPSNSLDLPTKATNNSDKLLGEHGATGTTGWTALKSSYVRTGYISTKATTADSTRCWGAIASEGLSNVDVCVLIDATNPSGQEYNGGSFFSSGFVYLVSSSDSYYILGHELGNMAGLADEYDNSYDSTQKARGFPNVYDHPSNIKWRVNSSNTAFSPVMGPPIAGPTGWASNVWRPYYSTVMRDSANGWIQQLSSDAQSTRGYDPLGQDVVKCKVYQRLAVSGYNNTASTFTSGNVTGLATGNTKSGVITVTASPTAASPKHIERVEFWMNFSGVSRCYKSVLSSPYSITIDTTAYPNGNYYMNILAWDNQYCYTEVQITWTINNFSVNIPILVKEALGINTPTNTNTLSGRSRTDEPLTVGIPIPDSYNITSISQVGIQDATLQQFRILNKWPSGNIQWLLVDTQISLDADEENILYLVSGSGSTSGNLATDNYKENSPSSDYITIKTGTATFIIKKSNFNFLDTVKVGLTTLISSGGAGGLEIVSGDSGYTTYKLSGATHTIGSGATYKSNLDANSTATIEENGPARCVIKCTGSLKDSSGNRFLDYIVRFHFYKNKSYIKSVVTLAHAKEERQSTEPRPYTQRMRVFRSFSVKISTAITSGDYEFASPLSTWAGIINKNAYMYQAYQNKIYSSSVTENSGYQSDSKSMWNCSTYPPMHFSGPCSTPHQVDQLGVEVRNGASTNNALGTITDYTRGWGEIKDSSKGMTVHMQWMAGYWPVSYDFGSSGLVEIGIFSKYNSRHDIHMAPTSHETRKLMLDFHTSPVTNLDVKYRMEQPVWGRSTVDHYGKSKAVRGMERIVDWDTFKNEYWGTYYGTFSYGFPYNEIRNDNQGNEVWRRVDETGVFGLDVAYDELLTSLLWGVGGRYTNGLQKADYLADSGFPRTDGFLYSQFQGSSAYSRTPMYGAYNAVGLIVENSIEHNQFESVPFAYYLTGEAEYKEAMIDYAEYWDWWPGHKYNSNAWGPRGISRWIRSLALSYEFDAAVNQGTLSKTMLKTQVKTLLNSRDNPPNLTPYGRNKTRGYFWIDSGYYPKQTIHAFEYSDLLAGDWWIAVRVLDSLDPTSYLGEDAYDFLTGLAQFIRYETLFTGGCPKYGVCYRYDYYPNETMACPTTAGTGQGTDARADASAQLFLHGWKALDDYTFLYYSGHEMGNSAAGGGGYSYQTINPIVEIAAFDFWRPMATYKSITPTVVHNGANNYTVTFTVPAKCSKLKIKYSNKPIVDWLGFNQVTRTYQYSPSSYTPWFSAWNYDSEPACGTPGTTQSFVIDVPTAISAHNRNRGWKIGDNEYITYNAGDRFYFQIRYLGGGSSTHKSTDVLPPDAPKRLKKSN